MEKRRAVASVSDGGETVTGLPLCGGKEPSHADPVRADSGAES